MADNLSGFSILCKRPIEKVFIKAIIIHTPLNNQCQGKFKNKCWRKKYKCWVFVYWVDGILTLYNCVWVWLLLDKVKVVGLSYFAIQRDQTIELSTHSEWGLTAHSELDLTGLQTAWMHSFCMVVLSRTKEKGQTNEQAGHMNTAFFYIAFPFPLCFDTIMFFLFSLPHYAMLPGWVKPISSTLTGWINHTGWPPYDQTQRWVCECVCVWRMAG